jgi:hypothetical protein
MSAAIATAPVGLAPSIDAVIVAIGVGVRVGVGVGVGVGVRVGVGVAVGAAAAPKVDDKFTWVHVDTGRATEHRGHSVELIWTPGTIGPSRMVQTQVM